MVVAGGVAANRRLRQQRVAAAERLGVRVQYPELPLCTDNGAMIALAAAMRWQAGLLPAGASGEGYNFAVRPRWPLAQIDTPTTA